MLTAFARLFVRFRFAVLALAVAFAFSPASTGAGSTRTSPAAASPIPRRVRPRRAGLEVQSGQGTPNLLLLVTAERGVDDPAVAQAGLSLGEELAGEQRLADVASYWSLRPPPPLASSDGTQALVLACVLGDEDEVSARMEELTASYTRDGAVLHVAVGGSAEAFRQVGDTIEADLVRAETITLVLLLFVFRSVVAALLPLAVGAVAVLGTFAIYALNLTTAASAAFARSWRTACRPATPSSARCRPPARPWRSAGATWPSRWRPCWCSCARSPTRGSRSWWSRSPARSSSCRRCWRCWGRAWTGCASCAAPRWRTARVAGTASRPR